VRLVRVSLCHQVLGLRVCGSAAMSVFADRLLEHPCVRHFLLAFDETEWPDVVQSSTVLGIQALICRYGAAKARLVDATCLRSIARWVERQGYWPYTLPLEMEADERPADERPVPRLRHERAAPRKPSPGRALRSNRTPRPGRPRRTGRSMPAGRRFLAPSGRADRGVAFMASARARGRSAPPALGLADLVLPRREARSTGAPVVSARHADEVTFDTPGLPWMHKDVERTAALGETDGWTSAPPLPTHELRHLDGTRSTIQRRQATAQIGNAELETSEWYGRLMSRLQRLNEQLPAPGATPSSLGVAAAGKTLDADTAAENQLYDYYQQNDEEPVTAGARSMRPSRNLSTDYMEYGEALHQERPLMASSYRLARDSRFTRDSLPEYEHGSLLLSELPSREGRREWHAISRGPWSGAPEELVD